MWTATLILSISLYIGIIFNKPTIVWHQVLEGGTSLSIVYFHFIIMMIFTVIVGSGHSLIVCRFLKVHLIEAQFVSLWVSDWQLTILNQNKLEWLLVHTIWILGFLKLLREFVIWLKNSFESNQEELASMGCSPLFQFSGKRTTGKGGQSEMKHILEFLNLMNYAFSSLLQSFGDYIKCTF